MQKKVGHKNDKCITPQPTGISRPQDPPQALGRGRSSATAGGGPAERRPCRSTGPLTCAAPGWT